MRDSNRIRVHHGLLSPRQRYSFYWLLATSFAGLVICLTLLIVQNPEIGNQLDPKKGVYVTSCAEAAFCLPTLLFIGLFCLIGIAYGCFFVVSHLGISASNEAFERHLQAVQFAHDEKTQAQERRKLDITIQKKYLSLLGRARSMLGLGRLKKAERIYDGIMHDYVSFSYEQKQMLHHEINDFYQKLHAAIALHHRKQSIAHTKKNEHVPKKAGKAESKIDGLGVKQTMTERDEKLLLKGKSRKFLKCWSLVKKTKEALSDDDIQTARDQYQKSRKIYLGLNYHEKKDVYAPLRQMYQSIIEESGK